jgi:hypothetical protein
VTHHIALTNPDNLGRVHMSAFKYDHDGIFRPEMHHDGIPVGYRRGQGYFCVPQAHHGLKVATVEEAEAQAWPELTTEGRKSALEQLTYQIDHTGVSGSARMHIVNALAWLRES